MARKTAVGNPASALVGDARVFLAAERKKHDSRPQINLRGRAGLVSSWPLLSEYCQAETPSAGVTLRRS